LQLAKRNKKDEFYTQRSDIERELKNYNHLSKNNQFKDKVVYCNCDDPEESNFFKYFADNFSVMGLKKLICTHYEPDPDKKSYALIIERGRDINKDGKIDRKDAVKTEMLFCNGDFRNPECTPFLHEADIVVTNPPFSLFREFVAQLVKHKKKFLIIGHQNAITYKEIFPLIKGNKMWLGMGFAGGAAHFINKYYEDYATAGDHRDGMIRVSGVVWFTNLDLQKRHEEFIPKNYKTYKGNEKYYPNYDNYDAINVNKSADIPIDYYGVIGVPITFLDKWNPDQFEIVGATESEGKGFSAGLWNGNVAQATINGERVYKRIFIKRKKDKK